MELAIFLGVIAVAVVILLITQRSVKNSGSAGIGYPSDHSSDELETEEKEEK